MNNKFDYKLQKSTLITFTRWLPSGKKQANKWDIIKKISGELRISFPTMF